MENEKEFLPEASEAQAVNTGIDPSAVSSNEVATTCHHCGRSIPAGNLSCFMCGKTVPMQEDGDRQPTFLEAPAAQRFHHAQSSSPPEPEGARTASAERGTYYPPRPRVPIPVEEYGKAEKKINPREVLAYCLLSVVLASVVILTWKNRTEVRHFSEFVKNSIAKALHEPGRPAEPRVTAVTLLQPKTQVRQLRTPAAMPVVHELPPAPTADFMQVRVDGQRSETRAALSSFAQMPRETHVGVNISRAVLVLREVRPSPLRVEVSPRESLNMVLTQVAPVYPRAARAAHVQGAVVLKAIIGKDGLVQSLQAISGHPLLASAAMDAVRQWMYRPYYRNGEPQPVETLIVVEFSLADNTAAANER